MEFFYREISAGQLMERCNVASRGRREPGIVGQDSRSEGVDGGEAKPLIDISTFPWKLARANKLLQFDNATTKRDSSMHTADAKAGPGPFYPSRYSGIVPRGRVSRTPVYV